MKDKVIDEPGNSRMSQCACIVDTRFLLLECRPMADGVDDMRANRKMVFEVVQ